MQLTYYGNACWAIFGSLRILIDPGSFFASPKLGPAQVVCITHADHDHVNGLSYVTPEPPGILMAPSSMDSRFHYEGGTINQDGWEIRPISVLHTIRPWVPHRGYLLCGEGQRILHLGDGNHPKEDLGELDILMITVGGLGANPWAAAELTKRLKPKRVFPMHALFDWQLGVFKRLVPEAEILKAGESREI